MVRPSVRGSPNAYEYIDDSRIDKKRLKQVHGELPKKPVKQNRLWYKLLKEHEGKPHIADNHKEFLLLRDLATLGALALVGLGGSSFMVAGKTNTAAIYSTILFVVYILCARAARVSGTRLVRNVLAAESA